MLKIVGLCITDKEKKKFLFIKREKSPYIGYWGILGGKVKDGEDITEAASRELFEESGINSSGKYLGKCYEQIFEKNELVYEFEIYFYHFVVDNFDINFDSHEGELNWINIDEFGKTKLIPSDPLMIDGFFNKGFKDVESIVEKRGEEYFQKKFEKVENKKPGVGVGVMILKEGKVLLGKRHSDNSVSKSVLGGEDSWTMPGGKLEYGESFEEAGLRETFEECGIKLNKIKIMCINNDKNEKAHFVTIGLFSDDFSGNPRVMEPNKITEWKWFSLDSLPEKIYFPSMKLLENYTKNKFYLEVDNKFIK